MKHNTLKINKNKSPEAVCFGTGLVALDIILNGNPNSQPKIHLGGSCGNVLAILSFMGWKSYPIARLSSKPASNFLLSDFKKNFIKTDLITLSEDGSTPIIIHRILKESNGNPKHRYEFKIPQTNTWLPSYKPVLANKVEEITACPIIPKVFYLDRISRSSIDLAKFYKQKGSLIFFEPSSMSAEKQFNECLDLADIIKFSNDRIPEYKEKYIQRQAFIEIETLGANGLAFRSVKHKSDKWHFLSAPTVSILLDTAGAGDWCSAGIIHTMAGISVADLNSLKIKDIESALDFGQFLGGANCSFYGARGLMYNIGYSEVINAYKKFQIQNKIEVEKKEKGFLIANSPFDFTQLF